MPEGHTIHRLAARHQARFAGRPITASSPQGRFAAGAAIVDGQVLEAVDAWGKHLFHRYGDQWLHVHLGLFGCFRDGTGTPDEPKGALRLLLTTDTHWAELRGPTKCELLTGGERDGPLARLGPDPLRHDADLDVFVSRVGSSRAAIGTLLMDQSVIAGGATSTAPRCCSASGSDRSLRVGSFTPGREVDPSVVRAIWDDLVGLMQAGVRAGRIVTTDPDDRPHGRPRRVDATYVYGRSARPCRRCGTPVESDAMAARTLFWCPSCQP